MDQTIGQDIHPILGTIGLQPGQIHLPIVIREKHVLASISPLGNVVGDVGEDGAGETRHA